MEKFSRNPLINYRFHCNLFKSYFVGGTGSKQLIAIRSKLPFVHESPFDYNLNLVTSNLKSWPFFYPNSQ
jgi:hypothetical protein